MAPSLSWKKEPNFGKRVRLLRDARGLTQRDLILFGVKQSYLANLETGRIDNPSPAMIASIARGLGVKAEQLVAGTEYAAALQAAELPLRASARATTVKSLHCKDTRRECASPTGSASNGIRSAANRSTRPNSVPSAGPTVDCLPVV